MRVTITNTGYTQINTNADEYLVQNITSGDIYVIIADTQPAADAKFDFRLHPNDGISNDDVAALVWGKSVLFDSAEISVVEG